MENKELEKLRYKFFREFIPERLYVRYQITSPYYMQAPTKKRLIEIVEEMKKQGKKIKISEVWWSMPAITTDKLLKIEETVAMLFKWNSEGRFQNGLEFFIPSREDAISTENGYFYIKGGICTKGQRDIRTGGKTREEALLKLCLHDDIKPFIKEQLHSLFEV